MIVESAWSAFAVEFRGRPSRSAFAVGLLLTATDCHWLPLTEQTDQIDQIDQAKQADQADQTI